MAAICRLIRDVDRKGHMSFEVIGKWAGVAGCILTAVGMVLAFYQPTIAGRWGGPETERLERRLRIRVMSGFALAFIGVILQAYASWPT